ncbi:MAG: hypothetical protein J7545_13245 [Roseofilum sp. SBFL]|uniref:regulator of G-protein signaling domain-containing protein n=1 Tax=unclassified Roseofilum TaxID=2620099 RepID=UPI001B0BE7CD|nr:MULTISPECIES: hypothetical protein [unclassified Roseofilum]MBP0012732.1 hypothetical protein [Roseofilum sp. SID3]MBP0023702.1 hypothetical protein [Roseofilum sp. SID2]MBP0039861.1 hypothetical protein [Roseofilum sp. SID1]MBP0042918.1 hypothetical protein [Roseofilum sp. SBFL]
MSVRRRQQHQTRPVQPETPSPQFTGPPGLQPKVQQKGQKALPQWQPGGYGNSSVIQRSLFGRRNQPLNIQELLEKILKSKKSRQALHKFLSKEFSQENLDCYQAIQAYKKKPARRKAVEIYQTYILPGSPCEVNLTYGTRQDLQDLAEEGTLHDYTQYTQDNPDSSSVKSGLTSIFGTHKGDPNLFKRVEKELFNNIMSDPLGRFKKTKEFKALKLT